jgi:uncharacterized protein YktA (UPF0223 family)
MEKKSEAIRRELLIQLVNAYGHKPKRIVIQKAKEKGIYKYEEDDEEIYLLIHAFAKFHKIPFGYTEPVKIIEPKEEVIEIIEKKEEVDLFYENLVKEHNTLSKKLLALNKLMEIYKSEINNK